MNDVMEKEAAFALQYGATEGDALLRELLVKRYNEQGIKDGDGKSHHHHCISAGS